MSSIQRTKKIALVDCNSFYVSCERLFNPKIRNKPVVVLSNNDGCVIARSSQAKKAGIKMGVPYFQIKELYHQNNGDFMILLPIMYLCVMMTDTYLFNQNTLILYVFLSVIVVNYQYKLS